MTSFTGSLELALDQAARGLKRMIGRPAVDPGDVEAVPGAAEESYEWRLVEDDGEPWVWVEDTHRSMWRTLEWRLLQPICRSLPAPVVDVGCGDGRFGALVRERIDHGLDADADAVRRCDPAVYAETSVCDIREPLPVPAGSAGSVFSNSTLEHVVGVEKVVAAIAGALRPGGTFAFTVPTLGLTAAFESRHGRGFSQRLNATLGHNNLWEWRRWEDTLRGAGFRDIRFRGYLSREAAAWFASRHLEQWLLASRRAPGWLWRHDLPTVLRLVRESLSVTSEEETTCVLVEATRAGDDSR